MSPALPDRVDVAREVQARRIYQGELPLASLRRLAPGLAGPGGVVRYRVAFGRDELGFACLDLKIEADLPLVCQRTLEEFVLPVSIAQRLGVIAREADEGRLPAGCEPLLATDGQVSIAEVIEDELILELPVVPLRPGAPLEWGDAEVVGRESPFALLGALKKH